MSSPRALQIVVKRPGIGRAGGGLAVGLGVEFQGLEQLEDLDPPLPVSNILRESFADLPERLEIVGEEMAGAFTRIDDFTRLEVKRGRMISTRYAVYEFSGWQPK